MQLTIDLPDQAFQRLAHLAELTQQPLAELIIQSIAGNLPPAVETAPPEIQSELLTLQTLDISRWTLINGFCHVERSEAKSRHLGR